MSPASTRKERIMLCSDDEEEQEPHHPRLLVEAIMMNEDYEAHLELFLKRSLKDGVALAAAPPHEGKVGVVASPAHQGRASSHQHNRDIEIERRVKEEPTSSPHSRYTRIDEPASPSCHVWRNKALKKEVPTMIAKARGRLPHYFVRAATTTPHCGASWLRRRIKDLSNVKEEVYGALDSFVAWELEFPLIAVKKALKTLEDEKEWKRIIQVIKWMFNKGQGKTMGSYQTLLNALIEDGRVEEAEELFQKIFSRYMEGLPRIFFMKMISLYYRLGSYEKMFEVFADMEELGVRPDTSIVRMLGDVFMKLEMLDKYEKLNRKYPPPKFEYRYIKGKRIRIRVYPDNSTEEVTQRNSNRGEPEDARSMNLDNELEETPKTSLDRNVLGDAASGDLEFV
ncbi:Pentatricopeptide repeat-containing protein [Hordeum vulgare]|nr:Pentatricopeptide repeat-containing protein [Hordeum vulgare]